MKNIKYTSPNVTLAAYHCLGKIKRIENGNVKTQEGDVWPPQEEILDFIIVVAGAYSRYGIPSQSHFKTQVEI